MARRSKKGRAPRDRELNPYEAPAPAPTPRGKPSQAVSGAQLIFGASVVGPLMIAAAVFALPRAHLVEVPVLALLLGIALAVGSYRLTAGRDMEPISNELRGATRLFSTAQALARILVFVSLQSRSWMNIGPSETVADLARSVTEALLLLVAARHLALSGSPVTARAGRWLAVTMLAAIVAEYWLTRTTYDDMSRPVEPRYAMLVMPIEVVLWIGKAVVFAKLHRALSRGVSEAPSPASGG